MAVSNSPISNSFFFLLLPNFVVAWVLSDFRAAGRDV